MLSKRLNGKTVLITGAAGGIGAATARELARRGASVVLGDTRRPAASAVAAELPADRALAVELDVTDRSSLDAAVAAAVARFGGVDVVMANAGVAANPPTTILGIDPDEFERVVEIDLLGVWRTVKAVLPQIVERKGYVLVTSSIYAFINGVINAPYAMSKAGVESFTRSLRVELALHGASAGVLYPGWVETPLAAVAFGENRAATELRTRVFPGPLASAIAPEQVAKAAVRGIQRRKARIIVPSRWAGASALRGVVNPITDAILERDRKSQSLIRQLEQESRRR